ncbi:NADP-dependent leukotriene b4 12-hydroxydehydrogenase [Lasiodiplodia theobromae]|uniref:NADP-dependent leukotriene b4 12-hydroxydehydrogenase n=1 Tax=Lasiodiplodia theobromae TaxID=45133 RepID=UPI0015C3D213|nr:NADP-dependent leukotriene b4 12-hydroxydehydrogenase [Lasiodiplodia theobromae]KAF4538198.1 NADP-dependent leukotriene b4 12-hydroxydehydrogenase [Lasiodiplodia theobromae]
MTSITTRQWLLNSRPSGAPILDGPDATFSLTTTTLPPLQPNQVLIRVKYISNDPAQRQWISTTVAPERFYLPPLSLGAPMKCSLLGEVVASTSTSFPPHTLVTSALGEWSEHVILDASACNPAPAADGIAPTHFLGALGLTGLAAYYGTAIVAAAKPADTVVVSGAAGATGSMVVQIAKKLLGCARVVGIAGGAAKCAWVKETLGADECVDYKAASFAEDLAAATPDFADVYFDNVGGEVLDLMLARMKMRGRVAVCGSMATYNAFEDGTRLRNWFEVVAMRLQLTGFVVLDWLHKAPETIAELVRAAQEGKIVLGDENEMVLETAFEDIPKTWMRLFEGGSRGKLISQLC